MKDDPRRAVGAQRAPLPGRFAGLLRLVLSVKSVATHFAACVLTGQEADVDGVCVEHGETACVLAVEVAAPA